MLSHVCLVMGIGLLFAYARLEKRSISQALLDSQSETTDLILHGDHHLPAVVLNVAHDVALTPATMPGSTGTPDIPPLPPHSQNNPIDLTLDDSDNEGLNACDRKLKRTCPNSRNFNAACDASSAPVPQTRPPYHSGLSPAMSSSSLQPDNRPQSAAAYPPQFYPPQMIRHTGSTPSLPLPPLPAFHGPSNSAAFFHAPQPNALPPRALMAPTHSPSPMPPPPHPHPMAMTARPIHDGSRQIIDLTSSPSPPPSAQHASPSLPQGGLPSDLPPKTPVCIGQLPSTALVLYPIGYLLPQPGPNSLEMEWAPIRLSYEHNAQGKPGCTETIHIRTPNSSTRAGEVIPGDNFAVVEQKAANVLGPMLGKGLIRLDGRVRRGQPNVSPYFRVFVCEWRLMLTHMKLPIIPLTLLVYTPKGNINVVANYLHQHGLFLDHPTVPSDIQRVRLQHYFNPHNPPPGGHRAVLGANNRFGYVGPGGNSAARWNPGVSGKSVEVQRSQVDELFKSLRDGDELEETAARE